MKIKEIKSRNNGTFKTFLRLLKGEGVKRYQRAFLSGPKQVREVLRDFPDRCEGIIVSQRHDASEVLIPEDIDTYCLDAGLFQEIDRYGTNVPILLLRVDPFPVWSDEIWPPGCTLFIPFQDPVNVGAMIRSAAAFGVSRVVMLQESASPFSYKSTRVAGSNLFRTPIWEGPSIRDLGGIHVPLITLSPRGEDLGYFTFPEVFGLLPGLEGPGLPDCLNHCISLSIPMESGVESLNAALATGITLYSWRTQLKTGPSTAST